MQGKHPIIPRLRGLFKRTLALTSRVRPEKGQNQRFDVKNVTADVKTDLDNLRLPR